MVPSHRDAKAAKKFKLLNGPRYVPRVINMTDKLAGYREREHAMEGFTSPGHAQRLLSTFSPHESERPAVSRNSLPTQA